MKKLGYRFFLWLVYYYYLFFICVIS